jgi:uncharacterized protein (DUF4415 family)
MEKNMKSTYERMMSKKTSEEIKKYDQDLEELKEDFAKNPEKYFEQVHPARPTFSEWKAEAMMNPKFREEYEKTEIKLKKSLNVKIDYDLLDKLRDIVYYTPGSTLNEFVEVAIQALIEGHAELRKRPGQLKPGRKVK